MTQNLMICHFCETSYEVKWKCLNCDLILCELCKIKIHTKIKNLDKHDIIIFREFNSNSTSEKIKILDMNNVQYQSNVQEKHLMSCQNCDSFNGNQNHDNCDQSFYANGVHSVEELTRDNENSLLFFCELKDQLETLKLDGLIHYNEIKQHIQQKENDIKNLVAMEAEDLISKLDKLWALQYPKNDQTEVRGDREVKNKLKNTYNLGKDLFTKPVNSVLSTKQHVSQYTKSKYGGLRLPSRTTVPKLRIIETYTSDVNDIDKIKTLKNGTNILSSLGGESLKTFVLEESNCITTTLLENVCVTDMTFTGNGTLLFTLSGYNEIKSLTNFTLDSQPETFTSISPLFPRGIHAAKTTILIGFRDTGFVSSFMDTNRRGIMVFDYNRKHVRTIEFDAVNHSLFSNPDEMTTNINGDICVIDRTGRYGGGRVVVLTEMGTLKWIYNGNFRNSYKHNFVPFGLVTTKEGFILVADNNSNEIHMLSMDGNLLTFLNNKHGILLPFCLDIDNEGMLRVGCCDDEKDRAKLHIVKISV